MQFIIEALSLIFISLIFVSIDLNNYSFESETRNRNSKSIEIIHTRLKRQSIKTTKTYNTVPKKLTKYIFVRTQV